MTNYNMTQAGDYRLEYYSCLAEALKQCPDEVCNEEQQLTALKHLHYPEGSKNGLRGYFLKARM